MMLTMGTPMIMADVDGAALQESTVQAAVRAAFVQLASGRAVQPQQVVTDLPGGGDVIAYQAVLADAEVYAVKISPYLPQPAGKAVVTAWTLLVSIRTGEPLLLVDSGSLTVERTAATTAVAVDLLARAEASSLAVIGWGPVGRAHLRHARAVRGFTDVRVYSRSSTAADLEGPDGLDGVRLAASAEDAVAGADVVLLCTSAAAPVVDVHQLAPGTLVTSVSTNAPRAHEIDPATLLELDVYADHAPAAFAAAGEMRIAAAEHGFTADHLRGDLAGLLAGSAPAPTGEKPVFFRSVGLGIEDAAIALVAMADGLRPVDGG
jgi:L-arginine dehydrogenase